MRVAAHQCVSDVNTGATAARQVDRQCETPTKRVPSKGATFGSFLRRRMLMHTQVSHVYVSKQVIQGLACCGKTRCFTQAVKACGKHWREVAKRVPARTDKQCRERYANVLDPELKLYTEWTPGEDALLLRAINEHTQPDGKIKYACCRSHEPCSSRRMQTA